LSIKNNLAYALFHAGRYPDAEALQREVIAQVKPDNGQVDATNSENLANTLIREGKFAEAVSHARRAVAIQKQREGEVSGNTAVAMVGLADAEERAGSYADAERDFRAALAIGEKLHAGQDVGLYQWQLPLADLLVGRERCTEAMPLLDAVLAELKPLQPLRDPLPWLQAQLLQGKCLVVARHTAQGETLLTRTRARLRTLPGVEVDLFPTAGKVFAVSAQGAGQIVSPTPGAR
jgi:tetratricopeptide (TPR) repeat protein